MKVKKEMNKPIKIILIVLVILLLAAGIYFLVTELKEARYTREMSIFEQGSLFKY
jgi:flagellar basal body-associated protein FliL